MLSLDPPARLILPPPVSVNALFRNVQGIGRVKTADYKAWHKEAHDRLMAQRPLPRFAQPVDITYFVGEIGVGNMDAGNTEKAATDALVEHKVLRDDSRKWVRSIQIFWTPGMRGMLAVIEPAGPAPLGSDLVATVKPALQELLR